MTNIVELRSVQRDKAGRPADTEETVTIMRARLMHLMGNIDEAAVYFIHQALHGNDAAAIRDIGEWMQHEMKRIYK